ncbi:MAG: acetyl-CoA carboxylase biotin carboxylase subunit [Bacteroidales bacterium]|nr:acetyl-CoA carboxylase biotin carboxylase subunit [Bacteroidales bacterium]
MIKKVLVANRGEIAIRVMRSCREIGITSVAVYSEADRTSMHVRYADEAYYIGTSPSNESYLVIEKIIDAAKRSGAEAIHPGYGFLSENAELSDRCKKEGIIFIGPSANAISTMGDKITARKTMIKAGVPVIPGTTEKISTEKKAIETVKEIGLPVMIKASAGGGGKGMRLVKKENEILGALRAAKSEALSAFGDDTVYVEKYIESPHHIEFQILADKYGNTIHLFERECSVQRRHQKVIEETPSPIMTSKVREEMGKYAVAAAKAVNYEGAGTIEFIVDDKLNYYFLEMNTRLQVEHPITERVVGIDLVKEQINIANGMKLSYKQDELKQNGHAIECRIYAEDPDNNFLPSPGIIKHITEPLGLGVRHDGYVYEGYEIPIYYDPLISKLIIWGKTRDETIKRMKRALYAYKITGIKTTIKFLEKIMNTPDFIKGKYNTHFIENNFNFLMTEQKSVGDCEDIAIITVFMDYMNNLEKIRPKISSELQVNNWKSCGRKKSLMRL